VGYSQNHEADEKLEYEVTYKSVEDYTWELIEVKEKGSMSAIEGLENEKTKN
jgi:hypothetical protein